MMSISPFPIIVPGFLILFPQQLPQRDRQITVYAIDGALYALEVYPTLTLILSTIHNKVTYTTHILAI